MNILIITLIALVLVLLSLAGIGIKILVRKNGEFKRHCANVDPYTGKGNCTCAAQQSSLCEERKRHPYHPLDINDELMREIKQS